MKLTFAYVRPHAHGLMDAAPASRAPFGRGAAVRPSEPQGLAQYTAKSRITQLLCLQHGTEDRLDDSLRGNVRGIHRARRHRRRDALIQ